MLRCGSPSTSVPLRSCRQPGSCGDNGLHGRDRAQKLKEPSFCSSTGGGRRVTRQDRGFGVYQAGDKGVLKPRETRCHFVQRVPRAAVKQWECEHLGCS